MNCPADNLLEILLRLESRLDRLETTFEARLDALDRHWERNNCLLDEHIKRTALLEDTVHPLDKDFQKLRTALYVAFVIMSGAGLLGAFGKSILEAVTGVLK